MAKYIIFVEQHILNKIMSATGVGLKYTTDKAIYYALDSEFHKEWIKDMKDNLTTHEKKKMTRKEAIDKLSHCTMSIHEASNMIDFYIEAGMLEIVEETKDYKLECKIIEALAKSGISGSAVMMELKRVGLKIVVD